MSFSVFIFSFLLNLYLLTPIPHHIKRNEIISTKILQKILGEQKLELKYYFLNKNHSCRFKIHQKMLPLLTCIQMFKLKKKNTILLYN